MAGAGTFDFDALLSSLAERIADAVCTRLKSEGSSVIVKPRLFTVEQAAVYLGRSEDAVRHMVASRKIPVIRDGCRVFLDVRALDNWIEMKTEPPLP